MYLNISWNNIVSYFLSSFYSYDELLIYTLELQNAAPQALTYASVRKIETVVLARKLSKPGDA